LEVIIVNPPFETPTTCPAKKGHSVPQRGAIRTSVLVSALLAAGCVAVSFVALRHRDALPPVVPPATTRTATADEPVVVESDELADAQRQTTGIEKSAIPRRAKISSTTTTTDAANAFPESARPTQGILNELLQANVGQAPLTPQQAEALNAKMREIIAQGSAAVPAIREFLARNVDLTFAEENRGRSLSYNSLRSGLLDALRRIGDPESIAALSEVLRTTAEPAEVAQIARNFESMAPGEHRQEIVEAARETLAMAADRQITNRDMAPVFQLLQGFEAADVVPILQEAAPQFRYYSTLALAGLPDGQGVPALIQMAESGNDPRSSLNNFALLVLSQIADKYPEAQNALLAEASANAISDNLWRLLGRSLAGEQMQIGRPLQQLSTPEGAPNQTGVQGVTTYDDGSSSQSYYSLPVAQTWSQDQINQRVALIDHMLAVNPNSTAMTYLQNARATLTGREPGRSGP
jgi:hypothetical protein